ncbi:glycoside hydrolase family 97 protein [Bacteroidota bacterium]
MRVSVLFTSFLFIFNSTFGQIHIVTSPDEKIQVQVSLDEMITYSVLYNGNVIIKPSSLGLQFSQAQFLGKYMQEITVRRSAIHDTWKPVTGKHAEVLNQCNELILQLKEERYPSRDLTLIFRAYNDGIAFRYFLPETLMKMIPTYEDRDHIILMDEVSNFNFAGDHTCWAANYELFAGHQEAEFNEMSLSKINPDDVIGLPLLTRMNDDLYLAITEADLTDWAGMYLGTSKQFVEGDPVQLTAKLSPLTEENGVVRVKPGSFSPWRVIMIGNNPGDLIESNIVYNLNDPCAIKDPSWIQPGISAWDHWWSGEVKMDTETLKKYIQLATDMGWDYMLIDWHWYGPPFTSGGEFKAVPDADILTVNPQVNMAEIRDFAERKDVKLLLWLQWEHVEKQMDEAFALYESWGIHGVKIDFMARDDQYMVNWYHKVVKKAAEHKLLVNFHGAYKPTGWSRTYPNLITREGVLGNEYSKWSSRITPEHNCTLPFTRMLAGHMDFTPGGFLNKSMGEFRCGAPAQVMSTRCHQLAMFVVYYSPLTVACDHPDNYKDQPGINFLKEVPTTWDDTRVLDGKVGEYIAIARKKGDRWYIGVMTNSEGRKLDLKLNFLDEGKHTLKYFKDAEDSDKIATNLDYGSMKVKAGEILDINMAPGGGFAAYIE